MSLYQPGDAAELADIVANAAASGETLEIVAGGSKRKLGHPAATDHTLDVSGIAGVVDYDPAELLLTARPGTKLADIETMLAERGQMLAFEPPDWRDLLGGGGEPTLGGVLATNQAGARRIKSGAARDHFLAFSAVSGWGEEWKAGGKVVKNVTGYDMCKLQAGAFGTLSVLTEVTVKVLPRPETTRTLLFRAPDPALAIRRLSDAMNSPHEVSGAAYLPHAAIGRLRFAGTVPHGVGVAAIRLEGPEPSVAHRAGALEAMFEPGLRLDDLASTEFWADIGSVRPLLGAADCVWRVCPTPAGAVTMLEGLAERIGAVDGFVDWGGGQVWVGLTQEQAGSDGGAAAVRGALAGVGGHATLFAAPEAIRTAVDVFEPLAAPLAALSRRIKDSYDSRGILNPRRMYREF